MTPYFPTEQEQEYTCPNCGGRFRPTGLSCCVLHAPGTCCHYGDIDCSTGKNARLNDPRGLGGVRGPNERWTA